MKREYRVIMIAASAIVIGAVVALAAYMSAKNISEEKEAAIEKAAQQQESEQLPAQPSPGVIAPIDSRLTYSQAVVKYADRRIEFDANCVAKPVIATYKNGTEIMLDNRAGVRRTITVDGKAYVLEALSFKIIKLSATTFPTTIQIDCGNGKNNASIYLQK